MAEESVQEGALIQCSEVLLILKGKFVMIPTLRIFDQYWTEFSKNAGL